MESDPFPQRFPGAVRFIVTMTKNAPLSRPAMSAIAAFLALSTPAAFAQEAPVVPMTPPVATTPPVASPPTVAQPSTTAPVAAPQTAQPPAPKPVIRVPLDLPAVEAEPAPKAAEPKVAAAPKRAERAAPRPAARTAAASAAAPEPAAPAETAPLASEAAPIAAPVMAPVEPVAEPTPLPAETATTGDSFPWELAGGAAALLIVGGAGLAFARRRRRSEIDVADEGMSYEAMKAAEAVPYNPPREEAVAPPAAPRSTPSFAAAPSGSMGRHEAMALAGPTPDNPFATLKKRLARARFLDAQERDEYDQTLAAQKDMSRKPVSAWEIAQRPAPAEQEVRRPEPARVRTSFRPGYSKN